MRSDRTTDLQVSIRDFHFYQGVYRLSETKCANEGQISVVAYAGLAGCLATSLPVSIPRSDGLRAFYSQIWLCAVGRGRYATGRFTPPPQRHYTVGGYGKVPCQQDVTDTALQVLYWPQNAASGRE